MLLAHINQQMNSGFTVLLVILGVVYLPQWAQSHLDKAGSTEMIAFLDLSSAFNTIHPALLSEKLQKVLVDACR